MFEEGVFSSDNSGSMVLQKQV